MRIPVRPVAPPARLPRTRRARRSSASIIIRRAMRKLSLRHVTRYLYPQPARFLPHRLLLRPREGHDVRVVSSRLLIEPACTVVWHRDVCGNSVGVASFGEASNTLSVVSEVSLEHYEEVA
jgi:hypothetical protein